jgi:predicted RecA/RadA family phage recombinase
MKNFVQNSDTLTLVAPTGGVVAGKAYVIGGLFVIAGVTADEDAKFVASRCGVFTLAKASGVAFAQGAGLYWDVADQNFNATASGNYLVAVAAEAAGSSDATVKACLLESFAVEGA